MAKEAALAYVTVFLRQCIFSSKSNCLNFYIFLKIKTPFMINRPFINRQYSQLHTLWAIIHSERSLKVAENLSPGSSHVNGYLSYIRRGHTTAQVIQGQIWKWLQPTSRKWLACCKKHIIPKHAHWLHKMFLNLNCKVTKKVNAFDFLSTHKTKNFTSITMAFSILKSFFGNIFHW